MAEIPERIVLDSRGFYWRCVESDGEPRYSMCPTTDDNEQVNVVASYVLDKPVTALDPEKVRTLTEVVENVRVAGASEATRRARWWR